MVPTPLIMSSLNLIPQMFNRAYVRSKNRQRHSLYVVLLEVSCSSCKMNTDVVMLESVVPMMYKTIEFRGVSEIGL